MEGFIGVDGGSTSTKAALVDENGDILCKAYQLSNGNPIEDTKQMFEKVRAQVEDQGAKLHVIREGLSFFQSLSPYHYLLTTTWPRFLGMVVLFFVVTYAVFGLAFFCYFVGVRIDDKDDVYPELKQFFGKRELATDSHG